MSELTEFRKGKDHFMAQDDQSPLTNDQRRSFSGLKYYDENPELRFELEVKVFDSPEAIEMQTSTGTSPNIIAGDRSPSKLTARPQS